MTVALTVSAYVLAVFAAARSSWSPCGLSMLSSITPIGERGRGHRFGPTAGWYVAGAVAGGATLGAGLLVVTAAVQAAQLPGAALVGAGAVVAAAGAAADLGLLGVQFPLIRRQVNELWLDRYRSWVYGAGFGWQIGVGFSTFLMTAAVPVVVVLAVLTGSPWVGFGVGVAFGAARGITVLAGRRVTSAAALVAAHRRYATWRRPVWLAVVAAQAVVAATLAATVWLPALALVAVAAVVVVAVVRPARREAWAAEGR